MPMPIPVPAPRPVPALPNIHRPVCLPPRFAFLAEPLFQSAQLTTGDFLVELLHLFRSQLLTREAQEVLLGLMRRAFEPAPRPHDSVRIPMQLAFPSTLHRAKTLVNQVNRHLYQLDKDKIQRFAVCPGLCRPDALVRILSKSELQELNRERARVAKARAISNSASAEAEAEAEPEAEADAEAEAEEQKPLQTLECTFCGKSLFKLKRRRLTMAAAAAAESTSMNGNSNRNPKTNINPDILLPHQQLLLVPILELLRPLFASPALARVLHQSYEDRCDPLYCDASPGNWHKYGGLFESEAWRRFVLNPLALGERDAHTIVLACVIDSFEGFKRGKKASFTPVLLSVLNFPTYLRYHAPFMLYWGLIVGFSATQQLLRKLREELQQGGTGAGTGHDHDQDSNVVYCAHCQREVVCRWRLLFVTADYKGLGELTLLHGQSGAYGCMKCEIKGERPKGWKAMKFTHRLARLRTQENILERLEHQQQLRPSDNSKPVPVRGVKGRSELFDFPAFDVVLQTPADLMHVLGHVVKGIIEPLALRHRGEAEQYNIDSDQEPEAKQQVESNEETRRKWTHRFARSDWKVAEEAFQQLRTAAPDPKLLPNVPSFLDQLGKLTTHDWLVFAQVYGKYLLRLLFHGQNGAELARDAFGRMQLRMACLALDIIALCSASAVTEELIARLEGKLEEFYPLFNEHFPEKERSVMFHLLSHFPAQLRLWGSQRNLWLFPWERHNAYDSRAIRSARHPDVNLFQTNLDRMLDACRASEAIVAKLRSRFEQRRGTSNWNQLGIETLPAKCRVAVSPSELEQELRSFRRQASWQRSVASLSNLDLDRDCKLWRLHLPRTTKHFVRGFQYSCSSRPVDNDRDRDCSLFRTTIRAVGGLARFHIASDEAMLRMNASERTGGLLVGRLLGWYAFKNELELEEHDPEVLAMAELFGPPLPLCPISGLQTISVAADNKLRDAEAPEAASPRHLIPAHSLLAPVMLARHWDKEHPDWRCVLMINEIKE